MPRRGELHRLAPRRGAGIEHALCSGGHHSCGERRGKVLHPPAALVEPGQFGHRAAGVEPPLAWSERGAQRIILVAREAQVERGTGDDRAPRRGGDLWPPRPRPALEHRAGQQGQFERGDSLAQEGAQHAVDQLARPALDQRQGGRDQRVVGGAQPNLLRQRQAQHHSRLGVVGQRQPRRAVDQRVDVGQPAQRLADDRARQRGIGGGQVACVLRGIVHRLATPQDRIEHLECRDARGHAFGLLFVGILHRAP